MKDLWRNRSVELKPFYSVTFQEYKIIISFPPFEFYEIEDKNSENNIDIKKIIITRKNTFYEEFIKELIRGCVKIEEFIKSSKLNKDEAQNLEDFVNDLWKNGIIMTCARSNLVAGVKNWLYFFSKFTNEPQDALNMVLNTEIVFIMGNELLEIFNDYMQEELKTFSNIKTEPIKYDDSEDKLKEIFEKYDFIVSIVNGFRSSLMLRLNRLAIDNNKVLLPVIYLQDNASSIIGPTVINGYSCWNCFYKRFLSTGSNPFIYNIIEENDMVVNTPVGFLFKGLLHKIFPQTLLNIGNLIASPTLGRVIFVNLVDGGFESYPVLKIPTCEFCGYRRKQDTLPISPFLY